MDCTKLHYQCIGKHWCIGLTTVVCKGVVSVFAQVSSVTLQLITVFAPPIVHKVTTLPDHDHAVTSLGCARLFFPLGEPVSIILL